MRKKSHWVEVVKASKAYGRHAAGWVTLVDGRIVLHGDKTDAMRIAERAGGANVIDGKRVRPNPETSPAPALPTPPPAKATAPEMPPLRPITNPLRRGMVVRLSSGEVVRLVKSGKRGNWLVRLLSSWKTRVVVRGLGGAKVITASNPGPEADPTAFRAAVRKATELASKKGECVFLVFDASVGKYEILERSPTWGRFWEVTPSGGAIAHNPGAYWHSKMASAAGRLRSKAVREGRSRSADILLGAQQAHKASERESLAVSEVVGRIAGNPMFQAIFIDKEHGQWVVRKWLEDEGRNLIYGRFSSLGAAQDKARRVAEQGQKIVLVKGNPSPRYKVVAVCGAETGTWKFGTRHQAIVFARALTSRKYSHTDCRKVAVLTASNAPILRLYKSGNQWKECSK